MSIISTLSKIYIVSGFFELVHLVTTIMQIYRVKKVEYKYQYNSQLDFPVADEGYSSIPGKNNRWEK